MKTSNKFTLTRVVLSPIFFIIYSLPIWLKTDVGSVISCVSLYICIPLLAFMEFTDYLDGHFARKHNEVSDFGKMFDPFADVIVHLTTFSLFMISGYLPTFLFILVIYREFTMNFFRMIAAKKGTAIAARKGGKLKTVFYVVSGFISLVQETLLRTGLASSLNINMDIFHIVGVVFYSISVLLAYISFIDYVVHFGTLLKE